MSNQEPVSIDFNTTSAVRPRRIFAIGGGFAVALTVLLAVMAVQAYAICIPTVYNVTSSAPPPTGNWTETAGLWSPSGGFPGCAPGDAAMDLNATPTTIIINSAIPNPVISLNFSCAGCVIDIQPGGSLTLAGPSFIGSGATLSVSGGSLTIANAGTVTIQSGSQFQFTSGNVDVQTGGELTLGGTNTFSGGTLSVSGGELNVPTGGGLTIQSGATLALADGTIDGGGTITNHGTVEENGTSFSINDTFNSSAPGSVTVLSGKLSIAAGGTGDNPFSTTGAGTLDFPSGSYTMTPNGIISGAGILSISGGTLSAGGVTQPSQLTLLSGTLTGAGFISVTTFFDWRGGTLTGSGTAELAGTGTADFYGTSGTMILDGKTFNNYGYVEYLTTTNPLQLANGAVFADYGTFDMQNDDSVTCNCSNPASFIVAPNGVLMKSGGVGTSAIAVPFSNNATVWAFSGTLELDGGGTHNGGFNAFSGAAIVFAGTDMLTGSSAVGGDGTVSFTGSTTVDGFYGVTGKTIVSGNATFSEDATTKDLAFNSGTINLPADATLTMTGSGTWSGGTFGGTGSFTVDTGATFVIDAANSDVTVDAIYFRNNGTVQYTAVNHLLGFADAALVDNYGTFDIQTGQQIQASAAVPSASRQARAAKAAKTTGHTHATAVAAARARRRIAVPNGLPPTFPDEIDNNDGATFEKSSGGGSIDINPIVENNGGTVLAAAGTLNFVSTYEQTSGTTTLGGGNIQNASALALDAGTLNGNGTITGDVVSGAEVAPGDPSTIGTINVTGNYTQVNSGALTTKLSDPSSFDQFAITGSATLDGTYTATLINGFEPANGATFPVMTFASRSGDFATKNLPTYGAHGSIQSSYTPTSLVLTAVVTPSVSDLATGMTGPSTINAGDTLNYDITITNDGPDATGGTITVVDTLPVGATAASASGTGWSCGSATTTITCATTTAIANAASLPTLTVTMNAPVAGGSVSNSATVSSSSDSNSANDTASVPTSVTAEADLSISKSGPVGVVAGQNITYTITIANNGPSSADNVVVSDPTPAALTFVSNTSGCTSAYPCNLGTLTSGQSVVIVSTYSTQPSFNGNVTNTATVSSSTDDPDTSNNAANTTTTVTPTASDADLSIAKGGPALINAGQNITYTVTVMNNGPVAADNIFVADATPSGLTFVSNSGSCASAYPCGLGTLTSGQTATITSTYNVPSNYTGGPIVNTATVSSSTPDSITTNNSSSVTTAVGSAPPIGADLAIFRTGPNQAAPGDTVTFTIAVSNNGPGTATGVVVSDATPAGLTFVSNSGACTTAYPCNLGTLSPSQTVIITSRYTVSASAPPTIVDSSSVAGSSLDPNASNNTQSSTLRIVTCPTSAPTLVSPAANAVVTSPVSFTWNAVAAATSYRVTITGSGDPISVNSVSPSASVILPSGAYSWTVTVFGGNSCAAITSASSPFIVCNTPEAPVATVVGESTTGQTYAVEWNVIDGVSTFELQESTSASFANPTSFVVNGNSRSFTKNIEQATAYFYRVRGVGSCGQSADFSPTVNIVVVPLPDPHGVQHDVIVPAGSTQPVTFQIFVPGLSSGTTSFVATVDKPWLEVTPTSGVVPPEGVLLTIAADPSTLSNGTWTGTVIVVYGNVSVSNRVASEGTSTTSTPVSISLVTPISPAPLTSPGANALVIPSVGHLAGLGSNWQSDVRVANTGASSQKFLLSFNRGTGNPSDGVKQTTITIGAGATTALDDIIRTWYGIGSLGDSSNGTLVIQPLTSNTGGNSTTTNDVTLATPIAVSSRTYDVSSNGTLGQFIPALKFSDFIGSAKASILGLQQIIQNETYRTNLGLVESAGKPANTLVSIFDGSGSKLLDVPVALKAGEQKQLNSFLATNNISLTNGHVEVKVTDGDGLITAYASVIDNRNNDPLLSSGVLLGGAGATRFVVPGVADLDTGNANWRSDLRVFNSGSQPQTTTLTFFSSDTSVASVSKQLVVNPGEVKAVDNVLQSLFGVTNAGGALHVTTETAAPLVVTGRTYDQTPDGTLGQFIPAVTADEAVGNGDRALNILQVEQSVRYRVNLGIAEVTGKAATLDISVILPDTKAVPHVQIPLAAYESKQIPILTSLGLGATYNARISVKVISGDGKVTAYGSIVDMQTQAPTYVPAQ